MAKGWTETVGPLEFHGRNRTEARAKRDEGIAALVSDMHPPVVIPGPGERIGVAWRDAFGWTYTVRETARGASVETGAGLVCGIKSRAEAERQMRMHLAQHAYDDDIMAGRPESTDSLAWIHDERDRADHARWLRYQRDYARAVEAGASEAEAERVANGW